MGSYNKKLSKYMAYFIAEYGDALKVEGKRDGQRVALKQVPDTK